VSPHKKGRHESCCARDITVARKTYLAADRTIYELRATKQQRQISVQHTPQSDVPALKQGATGGMIYDVPSTKQL
jgi:hypothetical protein